MKPIDISYLSSVGICFFSCLTLTLPEEYYKKFYIMEEKKEDKCCNMARSGLGYCLMIGLIVGALLLGNAIKSVATDDRVVSVKGLCEREVKADNVICPFAYKEGGDDLQQLYKTIERKNGIIIDFLKAAGINEEEISVAADRKSVV